jgi:hypothetical protein
MDNDIFLKSRVSELTARVNVLSVENKALLVDRDRWKRWFRVICVMSLSQYWLIQFFVHNSVK